MQPGLVEPRQNEHGSPGNGFLWRHVVPCTGKTEKRTPLAASTRWRLLVCDMAMNGRQNGLLLFSRHLGAKAPGECFKPFSPQKRQPPFSAVQRRRKAECKCYFVACFYFLGFFCFPIRLSQRDAPCPVDMRDRLSMSIFIVTTSQLENGRITLTPPHPPGNRTQGHASTLRNTLRIIPHPCESAVGSPVAFLILPPNLSTNLPHFKRALKE